MTGAWVHPRVAWATRAQAARAHDRGAAVGHVSRASLGWGGSSAGDTAGLGQAGSRYYYTLRGGATSAAGRFLFATRTTGVAS